MSADRSSNPACLHLRANETEDFLSAFRRVGMAPFKEALYEPA